jgi:hypothetical protein
MNSTRSSLFKGLLKTLDELGDISILSGNEGKIVELKDHYQMYDTYFNTFQYIGDIETRL